MNKPVFSTPATIEQKGLPNEYLTVITQHHFNYLNEIIFYCVSDENILSLNHCVAVFRVKEKTSK